MINKYVHTQHTYSLAQRLCGRGSILLFRCPYSIMPIFEMLNNRIIAVLCESRNKVTWWFAYPGMAFIHLAYMGCSSMHWYKHLHMGIWICRIHIYVLYLRYRSSKIHLECIGIQCTGSPGIQRLFPIHVLNEKQNLVLKGRCLVAYFHGK